MAIRKCTITCVAPIAFLLDVTGLEQRLTTDFSERAG